MKFSDYPVKTDDHGFRFAKDDVMVAETEKSVWCAVSQQSMWTPSQRDIFAVMNVVTSSIRRCHSKQQNPRSGISPQSNEEKVPASIVICISLMPATGLKKI